MRKDMIQGFEEYTQDLNESEKKVFPLFVHALSKHIGKDAVISNTEMANGISRATGVLLNGARVRKMINTIQVNGLIPHLVSSGKGYYVAESHDDVVRYVASIRARANSINEVADVVARNEGVEDYEVANYNAEMYGCV